MKKMTFYFTPISLPLVGATDRRLRVGYELKRLRIFMEWRI